MSKNRHTVQQKAVGTGNIQLWLCWVSIHATTSWLHYHKQYNYTLGLKNVESLFIIMIFKLQTVIYTHKSFEGGKHHGFMKSMKVSTRNLHMKNIKLHLNGNENVEVPHILF